MNFFGVKGELDQCSLVGWGVLLSLLAGKGLASTSLLPNPIASFSRSQ